jgi:hypothetical protein
MLYAKVIYTTVDQHTSVSDKQTVICADRFDFEIVEEDGIKTPVMTIHRGKIMDTLVLHGDVWVMNESGKTVSQFAVPWTSK